MREPLVPDRPGRPRWVYCLGLGIALVVLLAALFAVAFRSENYVEPEKAKPPIVSPPSAPTDGEASDSAAEGDGG